MRTLTVLGSTGSIGANTLDVVRRNRHQYQVYSLVAGQNVDPVTVIAHGRSAADVGPNEVALDVVVIAALQHNPLTIVGSVTLEPIDPSLFTPSPNLFLSVQKSTALIVWGSTCDGARSIKFTAQVMPARRLKYVTLWYRLQDKYTGRHTEWGGGAILSDNDQGTYFYDLDLSQINDYRFFEDAWFQYQLVASTVTRRVLGRSVVSRSEISLTHCKVFNP